MRKTIPSLLVLLIVVLCASHSNAEDTQSGDNRMVILRGDQLTQSITTFDKGEWGPIKVVTKILESGLGPLNRSARFRIAFNTYVAMKLPGVMKEHFLEPILVLDREQPVDEGEEILFKDQSPVYDWDSENECSLKKMMLVKDNGSVYLVTGERDMWADTSAESALKPQSLKLFSLVQNNGLYFVRLKEGKSTAPACGAEEVYREMKTFAESALK